MSHLQKYPKAIDVLTRYVQSNYQHHKNKKTKFLQLPLAKQYLLILQLYDDVTPAIRYYLIPFEDKTFDGCLFCLLNKNPDFNLEILNDGILTMAKNYFCHWINKAINKINNKIQQRKSESFLEY